MKNSKVLSMFLILAYLFSTSVVKADFIEMVQDSGFKFMYTPSQQARLLYDAEVIVEKELKSLGCEEINVKGQITQEMYDPGFLRKLFGEQAVPARYRFIIEATCPERIKTLQTYVSFAFHTSDIDTVFYYGFYDNDEGKIEYVTIVDRWGQLPQKETDFKGYSHCQEDWNGVEYNLLQEFLCD